MLIIRGVNVFPTQIESVILEMAEFEPHYLLIVGRENNTDTMELQVEVRPEFYSDEINKMLALKKKLGDTIPRKIPKSAFSAMHKAERLIFSFASTSVTSVKRPDLFSKKIESCFATIFIKVLSNKY